MKVFQRRSYDASVVAPCFYLTKLTSKLRKIDPRQANEHCRDSNSCQHDKELPDGIASQASGLSSKSTNVRFGKSFMTYLSQIFPGFRFRSMLGPSSDFSVTRRTRSGSSTQLRRPGCSSPSVGRRGLSKPEDKRELSSLKNLEEATSQQTQGTISRAP